MAEYHVGCGIFGIYAGTLNPSKTTWRNKTECTTEAVGAVVQYYKQDLEDSGKNSVTTTFKFEDGTEAILTVQIRKEKSNATD